MVEEKKGNLGKERADGLSHINSTTPWQTKGTEEQKRRKEDRREAVQERAFQLSFKAIADIDGFGVT